MAMVLLVDDERCMRLTLSMFLKADAHSVHTAACIGEAQSVLAETVVDVALLDLWLGPETGLYLARFIHEHYPKTQFAMMTGESIRDSASEAIRLRAFDYVMKPVSRRQVCDVVRRGAELKERMDNWEGRQLEHLRCRGRREEPVDGSARESKISAVPPNPVEEIANIGSFVWDLETDMVNWSGNMYTICGFSRDNRDRELHQLMVAGIHRDDRRRVETEFAHTLERRQPHSLQFRIVRPDGTVRLIQGAGEFPRDQQGCSTMCVGVYHDITDPGPGLDDAGAGVAVGPARRDAS